MTQQQTIQEIYQAFGRGDVPAIIERLAEDVAWEHDANDYGVPWLKPGRGRQHVQSFFGVVATQLSSSKFELKGLLAGDNQVVAIVDLEATANATKKPLRDLELHLWTFAPNGKVSRFRHVVDTHQHWLASRG
jgi:ketosteroid isomerase-like protein